VSHVGSSTFVQHNKQCSAEHNFLVLV